MRKSTCFSMPHIHSGVRFFCFSLSASHVCVWLWIPYVQMLDEHVIRLTDDVHSTYVWWERNKVGCIGRELVEMLLITQAPRVNSPTTCTVYWHTDVNWAYGSVRSPQMHSSKYRYHRSNVTFRIMTLHSIRKAQSQEHIPLTATHTHNAHYMFRSTPGVTRKCQRDDQLITHE